MILSDQNRQTLLIELHRLIAEQSINMVTTIMEHPDDDRSIYPPDTSLNEDELQALCDLDHNPDLSNALNKVFKDFTAKVLFRFFNIIDQTRVPDQRSGDWSPITLADLPEGYNQSWNICMITFLKLIGTGKNYISSKTAGAIAR